MCIELLIRGVGLQSLEMLFAPTRGRTVLASAPQSSSNFVNKHATYNRPHSSSSEGVEAGWQRLLPKDVETLLADHFYPETLTVVTTDQLYKVNRRIVDLIQVGRLRHASFSAHTDPTISIFLSLRREPILKLMKRAAATLQSISIPPHSDQHRPIVFPALLQLRKLDISPNPGLSMEFLVGLLRRSPLFHELSFQSLSYHEDIESDDEETIEIDMELVREGKQMVEKLAPLSRTLALESMLTGWGNGNGQPECFDLTSATNVREMTLNFPPASPSLAFLPPELEFLSFSVNAEWMTYSSDRLSAYLEDPSWQPRLKSLRLVFSDKRAFWAEMKEHLHDIRLLCTARAIRLLVC